jgi:hypothetical protein
MPSRDFRLLGAPEILTPPRDGTMLDPQLVKDAFDRFIDRFQVERVVADKTKAQDTLMWLEKERGVTVVDQPQGLKPEIVEYERFMEALRGGAPEDERDGRESWLKHTGDPGCAARHERDRAQGARRQVRVRPAGDVAQRVQAGPPRHRRAEGGGDGSQRRWSPSSSARARRRPVGPRRRDPAARRDQQDDHRHARRLRVPRVPAAVGDRPRDPRRPGNREAAHRPVPRIERQRLDFGRPRTSSSGNSSSAISASTRRPPTSSSATSPRRPAPRRTTSSARSSTRPATR